jgi:acyl-CoA reductase-like NAD-dependent aldehyde dehydrogenase
MMEEELQDFQLLIAGKLVPGALQMPVINPATEELVAQSPRASEDQLNQAVQAAKQAFPEWAARPLSDRRQVVLKLGEAIGANVNELARILTLEQGKPLHAAVAEVAWLAGFFRHFASMDLPVQVLEDSETRRVEVHHRPLGVIAAIVPWNYPMSLIGLKLPPALMAGNTVVLKPAPSTPLSALKMAELAADIVPPGVLNVIVDANDLGGALSRHPDVRKVTFTGSTATGKKVMISAAETLKRVTLELGGNDPALVLDDADPKATAHGIFQSAFQNSGQVCFAIKRAYVHDSIYDAVCDELANLAEAAVVGDGMEQGTQFGPVQNKLQFERVKELLDEAKTAGKVIAGGRALDRPGYFIAPTIVRDIADGTRLVDEEQFGPILPVVRYSDLGDAIRHANETAFGLGASVWSSDQKRAYDVAVRIEAGTVWVNKHLDLPVHVPITGAKQSGIGVEQTQQGLEEFTQLSVINM